MTIRQGGVAGRLRLQIQRAYLMSGTYYELMEAMVEYRINVET